MLINAYPLAQKTAQREIDNSNLANGDDRFDVLVYQYERLNQLADAIFACPKALELIPNPNEYVAELSNAKKMAAQNAYDRGQKALNAGTLEQARLAYNYFLQANKYVPGFNDVSNKINESRYFATLRVIVQKPYTNANFQYSADFFYTNLMTEIRKNGQNRFIRFYTPEEANQDNMKNPHQYIVLNFEDFSIGNIRESSNTTDMKRDSVIVGTVTVAGKTYNSYNTVNAKLTIFQRELSSGGVLSLRIIDAQSNHELQRKNFSGSYVWNTTWANFKGDDRALTEEQKKICKREPQMPPSPQDMFIEFTKPIYNQAITYIRSIYLNY